MIMYGIPVISALLFHLSLCALDYREFKNGNSMVHVLHLIDQSKDDVVQYMYYHHLLNHV